MVKDFRRVQWKLWLRTKNLDESHLRLAVGFCCWTSWPAAILGWVKGNAKGLSGLQSAVKYLYMVLKYGVEKESKASWCKGLKSKCFTVLDRGLCGQAELTGYAELVSIEIGYIEWERVIKSILRLSIGSHLSCTVSAVGKPKITMVQIFPAV